MFNSRRMTHICGVAALCILGCGPDRSSPQASALSSQTSASHGVAHDLEVEFRPTPPAVTFQLPTEGASFIADPCPSVPESCQAKVPHRITVDGYAPTLSIVAEYHRDDGLAQTDYVCLNPPPNPIEWPDSFVNCPGELSPYDFTRDFVASLSSGNWTTRLTVLDAAGASTTVEVHFTIVPPNLTPPPAMKPIYVNPRMASPSLLLRQDPELHYPRDPNTGQPVGGEKVKVFGWNLHNNPFLEVSFSPVNGYDPQYSPEGGLPIHDWCRYDATIVGRGEDSVTHAACPGSTAGAPATCRMSFLEVQVPEVPEYVPYYCGGSETPTARAFDLDWRIAVHDPWYRPERVHVTEAIPDPFLPQSAREPYFRMGVKNFPEVYGFPFHNLEDDASSADFFAVYGWNAFLPGAFGVYVPDPIYAIIWWPVYKAWVDIFAAGSCAGMSSTSQLVGNGVLSTRSYDPNILFPAGLAAPGPLTFLYGPLGIASGPPRPATLWAEVRRNHGVQTSAEFLSHVFSQMRSLLDSSPRERLEAIRYSPRDYVMCGDAHCVNPYRVEDNRIYVYDSNNELNSDCYFEVDTVADSYTQKCNESSGSRRDLYTIPLSVWREERSMPGRLEEGGIDHFLWALAFGSVDAEYRSAGGELRVDAATNTVVSTIPGGGKIPTFGLDPAPGLGMVALPLGAEFDIAAVSHGGDYTMTFGGGGRFFRLDVRETLPGSSADVRVTGATAPDTVTFVSHQDETWFEPSIGLAPSSGESAVFTFVGQSVGVGEVRLRALPRGVEYRNDTDATIEQTLIIATADGVARQHGRRSFGPFKIRPHGLRRLIIADWPTASRITWQEDGKPESSGTLTGTTLGPR